MKHSHLKLLERVYAAEIEDLLPYRTRSAVAQALEASGHLELMVRNVGMVTFTGYALTDLGRLTYCASLDGES